jgi:2-amino-4-hydroxy-6-hydroxymethyldihydropteridine diphosphokinase
MEFLEWEPVYERILSDFGYSRAADEEAARELALLAASKEICDDACLSGMFGTCATVVAGPPLAGQGMAGLLKGVTLSVGIGTALLMRQGKVPDLVVTDLDGDVATDLDANRRGAVIVVHAHGDNIPALRRFVPSIEGVMVPTTQSAPFGIVRDFGGFTDGDRAVAVASHFGVRNIRLIGFDLRHPRPKNGTSPEIKAKKLGWAERIIGQLELGKGLGIEYV